MRYSTLFAALFLASTVLAGPHMIRNDDDDEDNDDINIFEHANERWEGAICKGKITKKAFPNLMAPTDDGGCVRYYQGIDMTGVVTEVDIYFPTVKSACDCAALCLAAPATCTNWVFKHTFLPKLDSGKRSCTLYSSPNLPTGVTLGYNLTASSGFMLLQDMNNPQMGALAPLTFLDVANTKPDKFGVSGFMAQDMNLKQYC